MCGKSGEAQTVIRKINKFKINIMDITKSLKALNLFNEKAEELKRSRYFKIFINKNSSFTISAKSSGELSVLVNGPDEEATKAFVLTFRFFIQNNERCSIGNIANIYSELPISDEIKNKFNDARSKLNNFLKSNSILKLNDENISYAKILDIFFYGGLAHANEKKKEIFDQWMGDPIVKGILINDFNLILGNMLNFILFIQKLNIKVFENIKI